MIAARRGRLRSRCHVLNRSAPHQPIAPALPATAPAWSPSLAGQQGLSGLAGFARGGGSHDGIVLARSTDGGANWWDAVRVNGSDTILAFTPTVSVRRDGIVAVSYYELASASALPSSPMPVSVRIARSTTSDADTWRNVAVEDAFDFSAAPGSSRGRIT